MSFTPAPFAPTQTLEILPRESTFAPISKTERIASIDFIRGVALLGILLVNIAFLFGPIGTLFDPALIRRMPTPDRIAHLTIVSVCQGKFISIFSMLFGYGLLGQIEKASAAFRSPALFVLRRLGALAVFGFIHAVAIWYGDILFVYAMFGGWLLLARGVSARYLLIAAAGLLFVSIVLRGGLELLGALFAPPLESSADAGEVARGLNAMFRATFSPASPVWIQAEIIAYRDGPWADAETFRIVEWLFNLVTNLLFSGWQVLGMFLIGAAMKRVRFFAPEQRPLRKRVLLVCLPLGVALEAAAGWCFWTVGLTDRRIWAVGSALQGISVCVLPVGYLAGLAILSDRIPAWMRTPISSAGRMALTVYLLESMIATGLAYHWGLGWFGRFGALEQVLIAVLIWSGLVLFAWAYMRRFDQGPMEKLWRRLEYGRYRAAGEGGHVQ